MPIQSSFAQVASQIVAFNRNIVETLSKINSLATTTDPSVDVDIIDIEGVIRSYSLPSFTFLKTEIERLNNSLNSLYSIDSPGAMIQTSNANKFRKIITVDLNREPQSVNDLGAITEFRSDKNWFFDGLLNPQLSIELNLSDKVENNVRKVLTRRYIVEFAKNQDGSLTNLGQSALNSFNTLYRGKSSVDISEFENWHRTTPGIINPLNANYDEQTFDLLPNVLLYDGVFNVLKTEEDAINRKLWYHINTLDYVVNETLQLRQLSVGDELIINQVSSNTRYTIVEISKSESNNRIRLERVEGLQPIPVGVVAALKIYSPVVYRKRVRISVGYSERNVLFIKPVNADLNLVAKDWSKGTGFFTNDLKLSSNTPENGYTMDQYYFEFVYDYGEVLQDLVQKKVPNKLAGTPNVVSLNQSNFKVVQINRHLTDSSDANLLTNKNNYANTLRSEITQIESAITDRRNKLRVTSYVDLQSKRADEQEIFDLETQLESKRNLLSSANQEILQLSSNPNSNTEPKFRLRGFWTFPEAVTSLSNRDRTGNNTIIEAQEVVQFRVQYRYVAKDGSEPQVETFNVPTSATSQTTAVFSNWNEYKTDVRKRLYDESTQTYFWQIEDIESADTPNINQIDIPITANEQVEIKIKSISEVGWPESPVESDWSQILTVAFPDDLNNVLNDNDFILQEANREDLKITINNTLNAIGIREHLADSVSTSDQVFYHSSERILSGFRDDNGIILSLLEYLTKLENRVQTLEERINRVKGELEVVVFKLTEQFSIGNNSETGFFVELEDYLNNFVQNNIQRNSRTYVNRIYTIADFNIRIRNKSVESPLGLLSNRTYTPSTIYNSNAPQVFWVTPDNDLLFTDISGTTKTQLDNQFIWCVNYDTITQNNLSKLSENIGNSFLNINTNSLTDKLSLTEYNIGYSENTPLAFVGSNNSLTDVSKWIDFESSLSSTNKLLTTIHPVIPSFESIVEGNEDKVKILSPSNSSGNTVQFSEIVIPIRIYFKMNALNDATKNGSSIDLENSQTTIQHVKKLKFFLEDENQNRPFVFTLKFTLNRNRIVSQSNPISQVVFNPLNDVRN
jgi:hypothetical protein